MDCPQASVSSTLSWNTFLSRTSVSTLDCAAFSERQSQSVHGLEDVIRAVRSLRLRRYRYEELAREESLGEGETYLVEKAVQGGTVFAVKHLKISATSDERIFRKRLSAVTVEAQIMRHSPLRAHPNVLSLMGYGWNLRGEAIMPFLVVEYATFGTLREFIKRFSPALPRLGILVGDVASALAALHVCGVVHGDVKLDNVLVFPSSDRPCGAVAKLTDFGHALIMNDKSKKLEDETVTYGGTTIYNAPEVRTQNLLPIHRTEVWRCDIWAFGLLVWEAYINGEEYVNYLTRNGVVINTPGNDPGISAAEMRCHAKRCLPKERLGTAMCFRIVLQKTIQEDPLKRASSIQALPLFTRWNAGDLLGLEADLALHCEAPTPTFEMFRLDNGKEIIWEHQKQIFEGLKHTYTNNLARHRAPISWQIALCYHVGFGTTKDYQKAHEYSETAKSEFHPLAIAFGHLLDPDMQGVSESSKETYAEKVTSLLRSDSSIRKSMPSLEKAFFDGNLPAIFDLLSERISPSSSAVDGCSPFHWLFMFQDTVLDGIVGKLFGKLNKRLVNLPMCSKVHVHDQWPLQLLGSPLAVAISVNSLSAVKALLSLGADPFSLVYDRAQFPLEDFRSHWTAFHVAAKYHCSDILAYLLAETKSRQQTSINSLACVLSSSTTLERLAMHGPNYTKQLHETVRLIHEIQPLRAMDTFGRTGLMMAIDFQDHHVISALLLADQGLVAIPFQSPKSPDIFTYPIHFSAQIAARRDVPETLSIPKLLNSYIDGLSSRALSRDYMGKTPLHLAVTGSSDAVAGWIIDEDIKMMQSEDLLGRTPLYYCASSANFNLLLGKGACVNHVDKRGMTALHRACYLGASDLVSCLLRWKPRLDLKDDIHGTPLHCGVMSGSIDVVMALVEEGAPLNAADMNGNTAVHVAAKLNRHNILRVLVQQGADVSVRNINGRDPKAIALYTARNAGILSILKRGRRDQHKSRSVLKTVGSSSDFLWDEDTASPAESAESTHFTQSADDDFYEYEEQQETGLRRHEKLKSLDQAISIVTKCDPIVYLSHKSTKAVVTLLGVFFDDAIWKPDITSRIGEVIARAAYDLAYIMNSRAKEARHIRQHVEAWAGFLTAHKGIILKDKKQLDSFWDYMKSNNPVQESRQWSKRLDYRPNESKFHIKVFRKQISLQSLLGYMEEKFFPGTKGAETSVKEVKKIKINNIKEDRHANKSRKEEEGRGEPSREEPWQTAGERGPQPEEQELDGPCRQEPMSYVDHVNLAIDWITTIVMERKPQTIFPGRQKSDFEDMAQFEAEALTIRLPNYSVPSSSTLFDSFPQLSEQFWRECSSLEYFKWSDASVFNPSRDEHQARAIAHVEFYKQVHASCIRRMEEEEFDVSTEHSETLRASFGKAKWKLKAFLALC